MALTPPYFIVPWTHFKSQLKNRNHWTKGSRGKWSQTQLRVSFLGIFDIPPVYSNLFRLTVLEVRLDMNHSARPCMNYGWFTETSVSQALLGWSRPNVMWKFSKESWLHRAHWSKEALCRISVSWWFSQKRPERRTEAEPCCLQQRGECELPTFCSSSFLCSFTRSYGFQM